MSLMELMELEVFTAASLMPTEYSKAPGTAYSFHRSEFARFGVRRLDDLLQFIPGFQLNQYRKRHRSIWARGAINRYNDKLVLIVDGIQRRHLYYNHFSLGDNFPLEKIEKVEVVLGPASSLYGANAFGGIISITTRTPGKDKQLEVTGELADNNRSKATLWYGSDKFQGFASYLDQDAPFDEDRKSFIGGETRQPLGEDYSNVYLKATPLPGLTLMLDYYDNNTPFLLIPETQQAYIEEHPLTLAATYDHGKVEDGRIEAKIYYTRDDAQEFELEQQSLQLAYKENQDAVMAGASITYFKRVLDVHQLALGATWQRDQAKDMDFVRNWHYSTGFLPEPVQGSLLSDPNIKNDDFAVFAQDVWQINQDLNLTIGGRYDSYESFGDHFNYRFAAVYTPQKHQVFKLLYGTAIRTPSYREYLKVLEATEFVPPVPDPESIRSLELGYLHQWRNANLTLTLFHNEFEDYIREVPTPGGNDEYFANSDELWRMKGVEMLLQYQPMDRLLLRLGAAYLDAEAEDSGKLPYLAEWSGSLNIDYQFTPRHNLGLSAVYNSNRTDTNNFADDDPGSFTTLNLHGAGELSAQFSYAWGMDNLLEEQIMDPAGDFGNHYNSERSVREIWGQLTYRFDL